MPGTDHASIATEAKVVAKLASQESKTDLTREEFLQHAWEWTHKHGGIILEQLKSWALVRLGQNLLHYGRNTIQKCHQGFLPFVRKRENIPWRADG